MTKSDPIILRWYRVYGALQVEEHDSLLEAAETDVRESEDNSSMTESIEIWRDGICEVADLKKLKMMVREVQSAITSILPRKPLIAALEVCDKQGKNPRLGFYHSFEEAEADKQRLAAHIKYPLNIVPLERTND